MLKRFQHFLGSETDNSPLILWRMMWGLLLLVEGTGAILTGWVDRTFVDVQFTFTVIGFEWLQPLPGHGMYFYYGIMAILGLAIMTGYRYRLSSVLFFLMWTAVYLMQKSHYNNHYYLMVIVSFVMIWLPANAYKSLDVKLGRIREKLTCERWHVWIFVLLIGLVYITASLNKMHPDWMDAKPLKIWFQGKSNYPVIGPLLAKEWFQYTIAWGGIVYDGLIFFLLLHPRTRKFGFVLSVIFNLFNSVVFQIGIFPYMMIAFTVFFFDGSSLRKFFFRKSVSPTALESKPMKPVYFYIFIGFFLLNILLPLRHHLYSGDVHWTEEGHRLSWQMMLRAKSGATNFYVVDKSDAMETRTRVDLSELLSRQQRGDFGVKPDMIWQLAQRIKSEYEKEGKDVKVFAESRVRLNGSQAELLIDPDVDLASVPWEHFNHSDWILDENRPTK